MACPICDNKPPNCDCTELERRQHEEIERLTAELERHRMTEAERALVADAAAYGDYWHWAMALRNYLGRTAPREEGDA